MKDFFNQELQLGDRVAYVQYESRFLQRGEVVGFTPQMVRIRKSSGTVTSVKSHRLIRHPEEPT